MVGLFVLLLFWGVFPEGAVLGVVAFNIWRECNDSSLGNLLFFVCMDAAHEILELVLHHPWPWSMAMFFWLPGEANGVLLVFLLPCNLTSL